MHRHGTRAIILLLTIFMSSCANSLTTPPADRIVRDFPRPAPLANDPSLILLQITIDKGELYFVSLDQPDWQDMRVGAKHITMERDGVILQADALQWNLGQTTVALQNGQVNLDFNRQDGRLSKVVFKPANGAIAVSQDGQEFSTCDYDLIKIDATSGKLVCF